MLEDFADKVVSLLGNIEGYLLLDDIEEYSEKINSYGNVRVYRVGLSRCGYPLHLIISGNPYRGILVVGGLDPSEPLGVLTSIVLGLLYSRYKSCGCSNSSSS